MKEFNSIAGIKIFTNNFSYYATEAFYLYSQFIESQMKLLNELSLTSSTEKRLMVVKNMREAIETNLKTLLDIQNVLEPYVDPKKLAIITVNPNDQLSGYLKDFKYIKRDWSWDPMSEKQLSVINSAFLKYLKPHVEDMSSALFLGGGLGRIAYDLSDLFDQLYVTDKSFSMAYHFHLLRKRNIEFFEIYDRNIYTFSDATRKVIATMYPDSINPEKARKKIDRIDYFISDVMELPFDDNSVSAIFSIYFTDVIALKLWMPEIKRVLKPNGLFIHFGPLDYFFSNINEMYSATEIKEAFESNDFDSLEDHLIETVHLPVEKSWSNKLYNNWVYVARKKKPAAIEISQASIVKLINTIQYDIRGSISHNGKSETLALHFPDGQILEVADYVIDILSHIGSETTVNEIFNKLKSQYNMVSREDENVIIKIIKFLHDQKIVEIL